MAAIVCVCFACTGRFATVAHAAPLDPFAPIERHDGWPVGRIADAPFDGEMMAALTADLRAQKYPNTHAVLIEHDGKLVYELYLSGKDEAWGTSLGHIMFDHETLHDLRSITKSVTALLLGIALGENFEPALEKPIHEYFDGMRTRLGEGVEQVTLRHALTMTAGIEWNEMRVPYSSMNNDELRLYYHPDPVAMVLGRPTITQPGSSWYYNGGLTLLLGAVTTRLTSERLDQFAERVLFEPLGITEYKWYGSGLWEPRGTPAAASGLRLYARDLAKIGSLMVHGGRWRGKQIVPQAWIDISSQRHVPDNGKWSRGGVYGYGFQWWHGRFDTQRGDYTAVTGVGFGGQRLFAVPAKNLAITIYGGQYNAISGRYSEQILAAIMAARLAASR